MIDFLWCQCFLFSITLTMTLNWTAIIVLAIAQFAVGSLWFWPLFGKIWMRIHHKTTLTKVQEQEMMKGMRKLMLTEFIASFLITIALACLVAAIPSMAGRRIGLMIWVGFVLPMTASNVIRGNDDRSWMPSKIALAAGYRLVALAAIGYTLSMRH